MSASATVRPSLVRPGAGGAVVFALPAAGPLARPGATAAVRLATRVETLGEWLVQVARDAAWASAARH